MIRPRSQAVRIRIRVRLGSGDDMSTSECLGTSVMSGYGRIRSENNLPDQNFHWTKISVTRLSTPLQSGSGNETTFGTGSVCETALGRASTLTLVPGLLHRYLFALQVTKSV